MLENLMIEPEKIEIVWCTSYYDYPLSGYCNIEGKYSYFKLTKGYDEEYDFENDDHIEVLTYTVYRLNSEQEQEAKDRHKTFQENVGTHWDCMLREELIVGEILPESQHPNFYDKYQNKPHHHEEAIGCFTEKIFEIYARRMYQHYY